MLSPRSVGESAPPPEVIPPAPKRSKRDDAPLTAGDLHELPLEMIMTILHFLLPDSNHPVHSDCGLVDLARVSKFFRRLALGDQVWRPISISRWSSKAHFAVRLIKAEKEAAADVTNGSDATIKGGYWYRKFGREEHDANRSEITPGELYETVFSTKVWFDGFAFPPDIKGQKAKKILLSGLNKPPLSDTMKFLPTGRVIGLSSEDAEYSFYEANESGSIINIGRSLAQGTHPINTLKVYRRSDWGWEFRSDLFAIRSISDSQSSEELWNDYAVSLVIEKRKKGVMCHRCDHRYVLRQVPACPEIQSFLRW